MGQTEKVEPDVLAKLKEAERRHALALALVPLSVDQLTQELALTRAIAEVQSRLMAKLCDRKSHDDEMFEKMVLLVKTLDESTRDR